MNDKIITSNYGSIAHLSTSKLTQQADKKITEGQELILTKKARDYKDLIIVTEKIDGSNVGIYHKNQTLYPITRSGYHAMTSKHKQHHYFAEWVLKNRILFEWLPDGWRVCGEWCIQAHGTHYNITEYSPFVAFDIIDNENNRLNYINFLALCCNYHIPRVPLLHIGQPISINNAIKLLTNYMHCEKSEGLVYKCERDGKFDFAAKWVQADKEDGKYMEQEIFHKGSEKYT